MPEGPLQLLDPAGRRWLARHEPAPTARYPWRFFTVNTDAFSTLLQDKRINASPLAVRLLGYLPLTLAWDRWDRIDQRALADALGTHQPHVSAALRRLVEAGAVESNGRRGLGARYRLSKAWGWRGTPAQFHAAQDADPSPPLPASNQAELSDYALSGNAVPQAFTPPNPRPEAAPGGIVGTITTRAQADQAAAALARAAAARAALLDGLRKTKSPAAEIERAKRGLAEALAEAEAARTVAARLKKREAAQKGRAAAELAP